MCQTGNTLTLPLEQVRWSCSADIKGKYQVLLNTNHNELKQVIVNLKVTVKNVGLEKTQIMSGSKENYEVNQNAIHKTKTNQMIRRIIRLWRGAIGRKSCILRNTGKPNFLKRKVIDGCSPAIMTLHGNYYINKRKTWHATKINGKDHFRVKLNW